MTSESFPLANFSTAAAKRDRHFSAIPNYRTLPEISAANRALHGRYPALFFDGRFHASTELFADARRPATVLRGFGVQQGDRVVVNLPNCRRSGSAFSPVRF
jgi:non-ribosomal peptide synthetase component E (peptide arylation enzyme)